MVNFEFSERGLGIASPPHFVYDFPRKMFLILYASLLEILVNIYVASIC